MTGIDKVYFLGPFADRINFAAQQSRALNLAYALIEKGVINKTSLVAVVGAGVAGVTLTAALHLLGHRVHLIETKPTILARQRNAGHRQLHPTVNQWPYDTLISPTTAFPFFDWSTDACNRVLSSICQEWEKLVGRDLERAHPKRLHLDTMVTGRFEADGKVALTTIPDRGLNPFDAVIYTIGFLDESQISHKCPSYYWLEDNAEHDRDNNPNIRFVVSGTGDGGLIDAIRLCYRRLSAGVLALRVATALSQEERSAGFCDTSKLVRDGENQYRRSDRGAVACAYLWESYQQAARKLPSSVLDMLEQHRVTDRVPATYLVGRHATLVESAAAPIHKLIATYTAGKTTIRYIKGMVEVDEDSSMIKIVPTDPKESEPNPQPNRIITRHGAVNSLTTIFGTDSPQLRQIEGAQRTLADDFAEPIAEALIKLGLEAQLHVNVWDRTSQDFRNDRRKKLYGLSSVWPHLERVALNEKGYRIYSSDLGAWHPSELFGVAVEVMHAPEAPEL